MSISHRADQISRSAPHRDLWSPDKTASCDYRGDASRVEQPDQEQRYARGRYRGERERRGPLGTLYQDRDQKAVAGV